MSHQRRFDSWQLLQAEFEHACQDLEKMRFEVEADAAARANREARNRADRRDLEDVDRIPFKRERTTDRGGSEADDLRYFHQTALDCISELRDLFEKKVVDLHFLKVWGAFQLACGYLLSRAESPWDALGEERGRIKQYLGGFSKGRRRLSDAKARRRKFVASLFMYRFNKGDSRQQADHKVAEVIYELTKMGGYKDLTSQWLGGLLRNPEAKKPEDPMLQTTFTKNLPRREIEKLAASSSPDLPGAEEIFHASRERGRDTGAEPCTGL